MGTECKVKEVVDIVTQSLCKTTNQIDCYSKASTNTSRTITLITLILLSNFTPLSTPVTAEIIERVTKTLTIIT